MQAAARVGTSPNRGAEFAQYNLVRMQHLREYHGEYHRERPERTRLQRDHTRNPPARCAHVAVLQGVAYLYGFGVRRDARIAAKWFELSGLPEGMMALAVQVSATNPQCALQSRIAGLCLRSVSTATRSWHSSRSRGAQ